MLLQSPTAPAPSRREPTEKKRFFYSPIWTRKKRGRDGAFFTAHLDEEKKMQKRQPAPGSCTQVLQGGWRKGPRNARMCVVGIRLLAVGKARPILLFLSHFFVLIQVNSIARNKNQSSLRFFDRRFFYRPHLMLGKNEAESSNFPPLAVHTYCEGGGGRVPAMHERALWGYANRR